MSIEIKSIGGRVLYTAENAQDVRAALVEAAGKRAYLQRADLRGADLRGAYLQGADLQGADLQRAYLQRADLRGADLRGAYLRGADLRGADLRGAYLQRADLRGAYLRGAYLRGADLQRAYLRGADLQRAYLRGADLQGAYLRGAYLQRAYLQGADLQGADLQGADLQGDIGDVQHPLHAFRADYWSILDQAPGEVEGLRQAIEDGRINGSVYNDGECGCLNGTLAILRGTDIEGLREQTGIVASGSRPAERWFIDIVKGDKPLPLDTEEWPSESVFRISYALAWIDEWVESRTKIAAAFAGAK